MTVKLFLTDMGQIMGDIVEETDTGYLLENPVILNPGSNQVMFFPLLAFAETKKMWLKFTGANGERYFEPVADLRNHYNSQFGSGIQIPTR